MHRRLSLFRSSGALFVRALSWYECSSFSRESLTQGRDNSADISQSADIGTTWMSFSTPVSRVAESIDKMHWCVNKVRPLSR